MGSDFEPKGDTDGFCCQDFESFDGVRIESADLDDSEVSEPVTPLVPPVEFTNPPVRKSSRIKNAPDRLGEWTNITNSIFEPENYSNAVSCSDKLKWQKAMDNEISLMIRNQVFDLVEAPTNVKVIRNRWVFKGKSGGLYKARLVACGYSQIYGIDYEETFSPVIQFDCIRSIISLSA